MTSSSHGGRQYLPFVFTEHGARMAANVLNSSKAVEMSVYMIRAFVKMRETFNIAKFTGLKMPIGTRMSGSGFQIFLEFDGFLFN